MVTKLIYGGVAAAGLVGGFMLDRSISNTPFRVDKRTPNIARLDDDNDYDYDELPSPPGGGVNVAVLWGPVGGAVASLAALSAIAGLAPKDRVWQQTFAGRGALGGALVGASMFTGALVSRSVLG